MYSYSITDAANVSRILSHIYVHMGTASVCSSAAWRRRAFADKQSGLPYPYLHTSMCRNPFCVCDNCDYSLVPSPSGFLNYCCEIKPPECEGGEGDGWHCTVVEAVPNVVVIQNSN